MEEHGLLLCMRRNYDAMSFILKYKKFKIDFYINRGKFEGKRNDFEFDINPSAMKYGHKKFLSFDIFAKQTGVLVKELNDEL